MREISYIIVHCSASRENISFNFEACRQYHIGCRHYKDIGYHYYIERSGVVHKGRSERTIGAHCVGYNNLSLGICYEGGLSLEGAKPKDTRTPEQKSALLRLLTELKQRYPNAKIVGHHDLNPHKACPCFDARTEYAKL